jgi:hypothetical protein
MEECSCEKIDFSERTLCVLRLGKISRARAWKWDLPEGVVGHITMTCPVGYRERRRPLANPLTVGMQRDAGDGFFEILNKIE